MTIETYYDTNRRSTADTVTLQKAACEREPAAPEKPETGFTDVILVVTQLPTGALVAVTDPAPTPEAPENRNVGVSTGNRSC